MELYGIIIQKGEDFKMSYQEEKKEIFKNILSDFSEKENYDETNKRIKELFLKDSNNGKLYKYRGFDESGYTIDALETETLYCANREKLNDVFELEFAYSISSMIEDIYPDTTMKINNAIENIFKYLFDGDTIVSSDEQNIVKRIYENKIVLDTIDKLNDKKSKKTYEEIEMHLFYLIHFIVYEIMDSDILTHSEKMHICFSKDKNKIINTMFRTKTIVDCDEKEFLETFIRDYCNEDEQDKYLQGVEKLDNGTKCFSEIVSQNFNIGCLTTEPNNRLMWSHYGASHSGICIEYDFEKSFDKIGDEYFLLPVLYSKERVQPPYKKIYKGENVTNEMNQSILACSITKDSIWEYENEWRILLPSQYGDKIKVPKISCIYLGVKITDENKTKVLEIAKKKGIPVKQMKICNSTYGLKEENIFVP